MLDATELRALTYCTFIGGCLLLAPRQWVSAGVLFAASLLLFVRYRVRARREARAIAPIASPIAVAPDAPPP